MDNTSRQPGVLFGGESEVGEQRGETIVRSVKKAWQTATRLGADADGISIYLLGVAGHTDGVLLGYDFAEIAAFLGGVVDGEFDDLPEATVDPAPLASREPGPVPRGDSHWESAPLPPGMTAAALITAFIEVEDELGWETFGGQGGPAWGRVHFRLEAGRVLASAEPRLTLAEIRAIAQLPHPPPTDAVRRGYLTTDEIAVAP
jgi:hypothetical protein